MQGAWSDYNIIPAACMHKNVARTADEKYRRRITKIS